MLTGVTSRAERRRSASLLLCHTAVPTVRWVSSSENLFFMTFNKSIRTRATPRAPCSGKSALWIVPRPAFDVLNRMCEFCPSSTFDVTTCFHTGWQCCHTAELGKTLRPRARVGFRGTLVPKPSVLQSFPALFV